MSADDVRRIAFGDVCARWTGNTATCKIVVGADGRGSLVGAPLKIELHRDPTHHLFSGMLVEGADGWPAETQALGAEGDVHYLAFPQGNGRVRLYLGYSSDQPQRLAGDGGQQAFLEAFRLKSVPLSEHLANARPAGPCHSYPNEDTWTDEPYADGVVLIGDAAGHNDPIIGQGLSITYRDVRTVRDVRWRRRLVADCVCRVRRGAPERMRPALRQRRCSRGWRTSLVRKPRPGASAPTNAAPPIRR
jgi:2-polyprenyl-6-methoxyphenol hydroxylase-like FAD-dependent oxidoreductase